MKIFCPSTFTLWWLPMLVLGISSCRTATYDVHQPDKNGAVVMHIERTPCFGACPVFEATLYANGLLLYQGKRFTYNLGCHYCVVSKDAIKQLDQWFAEADFFYMKDKYPEEDIAPADLPGCVISYHHKKRHKTIVDRGWNTPKVLTDLENKVDTWISIQNLQSCDK